MNLTRTAILIFVFVLGVSPADAQTKEGEALNKGTIKQQFDYIINESNSYKEYKVIEKPKLQKLKSNVADSLNLVHAQLSETQDRVKSQNEEVAALQADLDKANNDLSEVVSQRDSIEFFGKQMDKATYKSIMWSIIGGLLALLLFFIFRFWRSNAITKETKEALLRTQEDFDGYKKRTLTKEQQIMRRLQDEINKNLP